MGLSDDEIILMIFSAFFDATHACDRQTDGIAVAYTLYSIYMLSCVKTLTIKPKLASSPAFAHMHKSENITVIKYHTAMLSSTGRT